MTNTTLSLIPRLSEKAFSLSQNHRCYVFLVPTDINKMTIAQAVTEQFKVTVTDVRVARIKGKAKRTIRKGRSIAGRDVTVKKAFVTLKDGDSLPFFVNEEKDAKAAAVQAKKGKK